MNSEEKLIAIMFTAWLAFAAIALITEAWGR